jgi:hypothetical protein
MIVSYGRLWSGTARRANVGPSRLTYWHIFQYIVKNTFGHKVRGMVDKVRENRLRRVARRQGYILQKSPRRDPRAKDFGRYRLVADSRAAYEPDFDGGDFTLTIDVVAEHLNELEED